MDTFLRDALRAKCCELALYLHNGQTPELLVDEVAELAAYRWAFRDCEDA